MKKWVKTLLIILAIVIVLKSSPKLMGIYATCDDPDKNDMFTRTTTIYGGNVQYTDRCVQGNTRVVEYLCQPQDNQFVYYFRVYECTYGCSDGACLRNPEEIKTMKTTQKEKICGEWKNCIMGKEERECQVCTDGSCDAKYIEYQECEKEDFWSMFIFGGFG